ncbi:Cytochrome c biogenesis CcmF N-terminal-like mitochondrial protein 1 [Capsicum baccatum]|uniref:Cytochrome c biogenesis CcmF N-terminal-like mitochondrial protein 1 n=1 Tax=Capsicum baccatum TaxID=33114 RepID=A0A2G2WTD8_CAPBA|nr:Cytochrome c biogenesis CcmF N-terminal-like mitochondrial protein 1 [Capsicum baccatum]
MIRRGQNCINWSGIQKTGPRGRLSKPNETRKNMESSKKHKRRKVHRRLGNSTPGSPGSTTAGPNHSRLRKRQMEVGKDQKSGMKSQLYTPFVLRTLVDSELRSRRNRTFDGPTLFYAPLYPERKMQPRPSFRPGTACPVSQDRLGGAWPPNQFLVSVNQDSPSREGRALRLRASCFGTISFLTSRAALSTRLKEDDSRRPSIDLGRFGKGVLITGIVPFSICAMARWNENRGSRRRKRTPKKGVPITDTDDFSSMFQAPMDRIT